MNMNVRILSGASVACPLPTLLGAYSLPRYAGTPSILEGEFSYSVREAFAETPGKRNILYSPSKVEGVPA